MALALQRATSSQRDVLLRVGRDMLDASSISDVQQAIIDSGALDEMESRIAQLAAQAVEAITRAPIDALVRERLVELARFVSDRKT
jgi:geranylgeranyl pyrophosphate synthase